MKFYRFVKIEKQLDEISTVPYSSFNAIILNYTICDIFMSFFQEEKNTHILCVSPLQKWENANFPTFVSNKLPIRLPGIEITRRRLGNLFNASADPL